MSSWMVAAVAFAAFALGARWLWIMRRRWRYPIRELPGFLSAEECEHLIARARPVLRDSAIVHGGARGTRDTRRSSGSAFLDPAGDPVVQGIKRRIAELTDSRVEQQERIQVTHYLPGERYAPHFDALGASGLDTGEAGDRLWTVILYLNDDFSGGATVFPRVNRRIRPLRGKALVFGNLRADRQRWDPLSLHAGATVRDGEKWLSNQWIRQHQRQPSASPATGRRRKAKQRGRRRRG